MQRKHSISVGVGRPVDDRWMSRFHHAFKETAPDGMKFMRRRVPGLLYVCGIELQEALDGRFSKYTHEELIRHRVRNFIGQLCVDQSLPSTAEKSIAVQGLYLERFDNDREGKYSEIDLRIADPNDGIVCEERDVVRHALLCQTIPGSGRYRIRLGVVNRPPDEVTSAVLDKVYQRLNPRVRLDAVGVVLR